MERLSEQKGAADVSKKPESPTLKNILEGKTEISFMSEFTESRMVNGKKWIGRSYAYKMIAPNPTKPEESWETQLTVWHPIPDNEPYTQKPEMQITISTGQGEMPFTDNPEIIDKIYAEISRQVQTPREE